MSKKRTLLICSVLAITATAVLSAQCFAAKEPIETKSTIVKYSIDGTELTIGGADNLRVTARVGQQTTLVSWNEFINWKQWLRFY